MRVYRVEHKLSGIGPYMHKWPYAQDLHADHAGDPKRPCPEDDLTLRMNYSHCYGFDSAEALKAWFEGWLPVLHEHGFRMAVYKAEPAQRSRRGTGQVSFAKPTKSVKSMPLVKL